MNAVSASVLDAAIAWQLCLGSGEANAEQEREFAGWLSAHPEHRRVWQQLQGLDSQLAAANSGPVRQALLQQPRRRADARLARTAKAVDRLPGR
jgi:transmembrane sensor